MERFFPSPVKNKRNPEYSRPDISKILYSIEDESGSTRKGHPAPHIKNRISGEFSGSDIHIIFIQGNNTRPVQHIYAGIVRS
jgi:hypothetical protein